MLCPSGPTRKSQTRRYRTSILWERRYADLAGYIQGFSLANNTQESIYQVIGSDAARASRFAHAMDAFTADQSYNVSYIVDHYDWNALGSALVVDVGGAQGHVGIRLAQRYPSLNILIQDMEKVIDSASLEPSIAELAPRVRFMAHDFFSEQPVEADVYYFRWIFHNWSDKYSIQILRCLTPALKHGARIVINDTCMPEPGRMAQWREKDLRQALQSCYACRLWYLV